MKKELELLTYTLGRFQGVIVLEFGSKKETFAVFRCTSESSLAAITSQTQGAEGCRFSIIPDQTDPSQVAYRLDFTGDDKTRPANVKYLARLLATVQESGSNVTTGQEFGVPDLSLVTMRQMAMELKKRENLCFALVWIEDNERDNIAIEGSGNPTQLVGLLSRGTHMAIEWADRNIKFHRPKDGE